MIKLKQRLAAIAKQIPSKARIADIGTDHAYLPIYLVQQGMIVSAVAADVHHGPYLSAQKTILELGLQHKISLRLGDGITVLEPGEVDTVVLAGMGGKTMIDILTAKPAVANTLSRLILQPMTGADLLRHWLGDHGWQITAEDLVEEDKLYEVIVAEPGTQTNYDELLYEIGPVLWQNRHPLLKQHISLLIEGYERILFHLSMSSTAGILDKAQQYQQKVKRLEEALTCL